MPPVYGGGVSGNDKQQAQEGYQNGNIATSATGSTAAPTGIRGMQGTIQPYSYKSVQTLRAVAAMSVALMHILFFYGDSMKYIGGPDPWMFHFFNFKGFGGVGIQIFFVISGFIMAYLNAIAETRTFGAFMGRRLTRIVPLYWVCTLVWSCILADPSFYGARKIIESLLFIPNPDNTAVLGPGWSLNFEMMFYALFAFVMLVMRRSAIWIGVAFLVMHIIGEITGFFVFRLFSDAVVTNFLAGIAIFHIHRLDWVKKEATAIFVAGVALLLSSIYWHMPDASFGARQFVPWGIPSMLIVLGAVSMDVANKHMWLFRNRMMLALGNASYALYLVHSMCFIGISMLLLYTLAIQKYVGPDGACLIYLVVCCVVGLVVHHLVEKPLNKLVRKVTAAISAKVSPSAQPVAA
ncbi:acyltransferase [Dyella solisilvae]|uniref:Acyltransferase n=1 Tax=Dyella solisilvae TaxID=1920168 RepID=A0A370KA41_9GAMM|nr:acyltransferase [Dyella solisilvae]RDI99516.1 acyltransferase [Dyella solisilvae]